MLRRVSVVLLSAGALALGACSSSSTPPPDGGATVSCTTSTTPICTIPVGASETAISSAIASAVAGTTFNFAAGTFNFTNTITVNNAANLTFKGAGIGQTILEFAGQTAGSGGISATLGNSNIRFEGFTIQNTLGDGIKVETGIGVVFSQVQVRWLNAADGGPNYPRHGGYGIYPVKSQNVLVDNCDISGARDTGAYIGQSFNIVVSNNKVHDNVAGIEIESSVNADVHDNNATNNTGGILVFALPSLLPPAASGVTTDMTRNVRVFNNTITANNTINFADPSGTVAAVPGGTGVVVMASDYVEVYSNQVTNNNTVAFGLISYTLTNQAWDPTSPTDNPTGLNPIPDNVYVHDNTFSGNGTSPSTNNLYPGPDGGTQNQLGALIAGIGALGGWATTGGVPPDLAWDGIADFTTYTPPAVGVDAGTPPNPVNFFIENNHDASAIGSGFVDLNLKVVGVPVGPLPINVQGLAFDGTPFIVSSPPPGFPLPAVDAGILP